MYNHTHQARWSEKHVKAGYHGILDNQQQALSEDNVMFYIHNNMKYNNFDIMGLHIVNNRFLDNILVQYYLGSSMYYWGLI